MLGLPSKSRTNLENQTSELDIAKTEIFRVELPLIMKPWR